MISLIKLYYKTVRPTGDGYAMFLPEPIFEQARTIPATGVHGFSGQSFA
jgi:hypothetical protein